ncbi:MAG: hypothetical protein MUE44_19425 [Oscillatoriaceae cyanobacterium Prado104]|nr:hypothetical protein [Oscillatoriaceae cyanobacterium Prado104]
MKNSLKVRSGDKRAEIYLEFACLPLWRLRDRITCTPAIPAILTKRQLSIHPEG